MKIINNNCSTKNVVKEEPEVVNVFCESCGSELEIIKEDTHIGWLGSRYFTCPCCGEESLVEEFEGVTLNINTLKFPDHFHRTNKDLRHVAEVTDSELRASIKQAIDFFRANKDEWSWFTMYGDLFLQVYRFDGDEEYSIVIARDFYEATLQFETVDYNK
jgi:hypothetical protein